MPHASLYRVDQVAFRYPRSGAAQGWSVEDVSFSVAPGEVCGIIGPNGSGKTTLLKLLVRLLVPQQGTIHLLGRALETYGPQALAKMVAYVPQDTSVTFPFTVAQTVLMGRYARREGRHGAFLNWETPDDLTKVEAAMEMMQVTSMAARKLVDLSGGERQRVVMARAMAQEPAVLVLDEPTAALDLRHQWETFRLLRALSATQGITVVLVSHDVNLASQFCDRLVLLDRGRVAAMGSPEAVMQPDILEPVYGCSLLVDCHPVSGAPRVTLPGR